MKRNNAGISLVEIVIVIAILSILTATGAYSLSQLTGYRAREAADKVASSLAENKVVTLGKAKKPGGMAWEISRDGDDYFVSTVYDIGTGSEYRSNREQINEGKVDVKVYEEWSVGSIWIPINDGRRYRIYFNRGTGALLDMYGNPAEYDVLLRFTSGRKTYDVKVISKTGKVISDTVRKE
ncbi:MAG: prepilin-type N-terminal cleavage/methylation domain-containing protein [Lachnospiraceae bacterium]|nr:prepilin-type N-terminal cleavage/methylation domain-containing protein [Lachnospiraceae bacterium]